MPFSTTHGVRSCRSFFGSRKIKKPLSDSSQAWPCNECHWETPWRDPTIQESFRGASIPCIRAHSPENAFLSLWSSCSEGRIDVKHNLCLPKSTLLLEWLPRTFLSLDSFDLKCKNCSVGLHTLICSDFLARRNSVFVQTLWEPGHVLCSVFIIISPANSS